MLDDKKLYSFQEAGFQVFRKDGKTKLVKGRCEVHLSAVEGSLMMAIPVVRIQRQGQLPARVTEYLTDRNTAHGGPGRFEIEGGMIWYRAFARPDDRPEAVAEGAVSAVEKIGPKILNLLK